MKKIILVLFMIPIFSFGQENSNTKNGLENLLEKAEKLVKNIDISFNKKEEKKIDLNLENKIINLWKNYSKAFEYKDYKKVASFFSYPSTFGTSSNSIILNNKSELIKKYKNIRETTIQNGYKYSLLDNYEFTMLSEKICFVKVTYGRFDSNYNRIHTGKGIYYYKKIKNEWKMYFIDSVLKDVK